MKKIFGILICMLVIACAYTTTAISTNFSDNKKSDEILPANFEEPIQPIVEAEKIDGRTWNVKIYAYNTLDEEVTIKVRPHMVYTIINILEPEQYYTLVYESPLAKNMLPTLIFAILGIYPDTKSFSAHEKVLLDEFTFKGRSNRCLYARLYTHIPLKLPDGLYGVDSYLDYEFNGESSDSIGGRNLAYITLES